MEWFYPKRRGPEWKQGWTGQTLSSISAPPLHLLTIFAIRRHPQHELANQASGGSPWGVAILVVLVLVLLSYQSSFHSKCPRSSLSIFSSSVGALEAEDGGTEVVIAAALGFDSEVEAPVHHHRLRRRRRWRQIGPIIRASLPLVSSGFASSPSLSLEMAEERRSWSTFSAESPLSPGGGREGEREREREKKSDRDVKGKCVEL
ncbi:hypothetical protein ACLB2K_050812 [Fragaria x ananassa]